MFSSESDVYPLHSSVTLLSSHEKICTRLASTFPVSVFIQRFLVTIQAQALPQNNARSPSAATKHRKWIQL